MQTELRNINTAAPKLEGNTLYGTAIPYNSLSHDLGGFVERFMPGSVADTIKSGLIEANLYHNPNMPVGSQAAGTLRLFDRPHGLDYEVDLPDTSYVADFRKLLNSDRQDVGGTSFGFWPDAQGEQWSKEGGSVVRTITRATLQHVSPVITPAYPATTANLRALAQGELSPEELYGLDLQKLSQIFVAIKRGLQLDDTEVEVARAAMGCLCSALPRTRLLAAQAKANNMLL